MILQSLRGQFLFLYESGVLNFYVYAIIEEALEPALDAAHGELQDLKVSLESRWRNNLSSEFRQILAKFS